jgi:glycine dehydrogenase
MVADLTGLPIANASLLDEATAAAEAMTMCAAMPPQDEGRGVLRRSRLPSADDRGRRDPRAEPLGIEGRGRPTRRGDFSGRPVFGVLLQYPDDRRRASTTTARSSTRCTPPARSVVARRPAGADAAEPPGELGADIAVGSAQRFGVPMGYGGPHAAFMAPPRRPQAPDARAASSACRGRRGKPALRLALQTREQHIRREKATSNICTAQVLLAVMAAMYAVYHGPDGLRAIARACTRWRSLVAAGLRRSAIARRRRAFFDTCAVELTRAARRRCADAARRAGINLRARRRHVGIALDETTTLAT